MLDKNDVIDLKNLFSQGDQVPWPDNNEKGFLSRKYCKNLWTLGARTTMTQNESNTFINNIITCLNVFNFAANNNSSLIDCKNDENIYIAAHNELSTYLRNLFIYYNSLVTDDELIKIIEYIPLIKYIKSEKNKGNNIYITTYNYDIFLERILRLSNIPFNVVGFERKNTKIQILKPHGSISFISKKSTIGKNFEIKRTFDSVSIDVNELTIDYNLEKDISLVNAIIPPAGDTNRLNIGWGKSIREELIKRIEFSNEKDTLIIFGLSYDHVDRFEIDEIITSISPDINIKYINPFPSVTLDAVLSSIFKNYIHLKNSNQMEVKK